MLIKNLLPLLLLSVFAFCGELPRNSKNSNSIFYLGGIQINEPDDDVWVSTLQSTGLNSVSVTVYAEQGDWDSENLTFNLENQGVLNEIRLAKAKGLRVVLILRVRLDEAYPRNAALWHGMIAPGAEKVLNAWFAKYEEFVVTWARIAETEGVEIFVIGSELNALSATTTIDHIPGLISYFADSLRQAEEKERILAHSDMLRKGHSWALKRSGHATFRADISAQQQAKSIWAKQVSYFGEPDRLAKINRRRRRLNELWTGLARETRRHFKGLTTYAANFDNYEEVGFWEHLDLIGINAYFSLRTAAVNNDSTEPLLAQFEESWQGIMNRIDSLRARHDLQDRPVLFTELGYTNRKNSTYNPWQGVGFALVEQGQESRLVIRQQEPIDYAERAVAIRALRNVHNRMNQSFLQGILYWKLSTQLRHQEIEPFMLYVGLDSQDPLLAELLQFLSE